MLVCSKALVMDRVLLPAAEVWWHGWSRLLQAEQQLCDTSVRPGAPALAPCKKPAKHPWVAQLPLHETSGFNRYVRRRQVGFAFVPWASSLLKESASWPCWYCSSLSVPV